MQQRTSSSGVAPGVALVAGILAVIGSFLSWAKASVPQGGLSVAAKGIDGWEGKATIVGGVILLVGGISALTGQAGARQRLRVSALIGGAMAAGVGIYTAITAKDQVIDSAASEIAKELSVTLEQAKAAVHQAIDQGALKIGLELGIFVVIGAGVIGIVAAVAATMSGGEVSPSAMGMPAATATGAGLTSWAAAPPPPQPEMPAAPPPESPWAAPSPTAPPVPPAEHVPPEDPGQQ